MADKNIFTFSKLIDCYNIEIPAIQRDYAQGRNTQKAIEIRTAIVNNFYTALQENGTPVDFDFIYGRIEDRDNTRIFIPIDGQQRLTTLYLLHLYLWHKSCPMQNTFSENAQKCAENLKNFSYATRVSSKEFCKAMADNKILDENTEYTPERYIKDQPWFYPEWEKNPTITGMLRTLNTIHEKFKGVENPENFFEKLTNTNAVFFQFKDLGNTLSDEIYLKMNARYLSLTSFENFKAKFEQYLKKNLIDDLPLEQPQKEKCEIWSTLSPYKKVAWKFDNDWLSGFWNIAKEKSNVSAMMMSAIANIFRFYALLGNDEQKADYFKEIADGDKSFVSFDNFEKIVTKDLLLNLFAFMENLYQGKYRDISPAWTAKEEFCLLMPKNDLERIVFAAVVFYGKIDNQEKFQDWLRVIWNIAENSTTDLKNLLTFLHTFLLPGCHNILAHLTKLSVEKMDNGKYIVISNAGAQETNFETAAVQLKEECEKAVQIMGWRGNYGMIDGVWYHRIKDAEKYAFFHGCIRFLYRNADGIPNWNDFDAKYMKARLYFDEKGIKEEYRVCMTKYLVYSAFNELKIWEKGQGGHGYFFDCSGDSWLKHILKIDGWGKMVDSILRETSFPILIPPESNPYLKDLKRVLEAEDFPWNFMINNMPSARFNWYDNHYCFYAGRYSNAIYVDCRGWNRNKILKELHDSPEAEITIPQPIENSSLFFGYDIPITYKNKEFVWSPSNTSPERSNIFLCNSNPESSKQNVQIDTKDKLLDILDELLMPLAGIR